MIRPAQLPLAPGAPGGGVEVRLLAADPGNESGELRMASKCLCRRIAAFERLVVEHRMDGAVADRMDRLGFPPTARFRDGVMPFHLSAERSAAQETGRR